MAFNPKDLNQYQKFLELQNNISKQMSKSTLDFTRGIADAAKAKRELIRSQKRLNDLEKEELALRERMRTLSGEELEIAKKRLATVQLEKKEVQAIVDQNKALSKALSNQVLSLKNVSVAVSRDIFKGLTKLVGVAGKLTVKVKQLGVEFSENDDIIRRTAVNIGIMGKQFDMMRKTAYKAALVTQRMGVDAKDLVQMYGSYVDEVGRLVPLSYQASKALAAMSKGTALGAEGAAQMAASMEIFGMSIESTASYVEDVVNMSEKMGVNSGKVLKVLQQNLRKANTVRFKDGVDGMAKMAAKAVKIRADMGATLSFAQQLWEPEKAIETAAQLQMMGGAFARMADPIGLMFDARNNPAKLMTDLAEAAASVVKRSKDGIYEIPTMELQKLKHVAESTGQDFETIVESAKTLARQKDIAKALNPRISKDAKEFITSIAETRNGEFVVNVGGEFKKVSDLTQGQIDSMFKQEETLKERAMAAQGFMTKLENLMKSLKNLAMSFFAGLDTTLGPLLDKLTGRGEGSLGNLSDALFKLGADFGRWINETAQPFITKAIPMIGSLVGRLTEVVGKTSGFFSDRVLPVLKKIGDYMVSFWEKHGPLLMDMGRALMKVGSLLLSGLQWIRDTFGVGGLVATIFLVRFPGIIKGLISGISSAFGGLRSIFGGGVPGSSPGNPSYVVPIGGGMGGPGGGFDPTGMGRGGSRFYNTMGRGFMGRLGSQGGRDVLSRAARMGKLGFGQRALLGLSKGVGGFMGGMNLASTSGMSMMGRGGLRGMGFMGRAGFGLAKGGPLALLGLGTELGRSFMDDPDSALGKGLGVLGTTASDAATGMLIGSIIPGIGTAIGGIIGGIIGFGRSMYTEMTTKGKSDYNMSGAQANIGQNRMAMASTSYMADGAVMPSGNVIKTAKGKMYQLSPRDVAVVGQPGGAGGGGGVVSVNISGNITVSAGAGTTSVSLDGLLKDPVFKSEITKIVVKQMKEQNR